MNNTQPNTVQQSTGSQNIPNADRRKYTRYFTDLPLRYALLNDPNYSSGIVKDISKGGICFLGRSPLRLNTSVRLFLGSPAQSAVAGKSGRLTRCLMGRVVRSLELKNGEYEIGVSFALSTRDTPKQPRRHKRFSVKMMGLCRRDNDQDGLWGRVTDMSRSGVRILLPEEFGIAQRFQIIVCRSLFEQYDPDVVAEARVVWQKTLKTKLYEMGCEFVHVDRIGKQTGSADKQ